MLTFRMGDFERASRRMGALASQMPFALAGALNASAEIGRRTLIEDTWPQHVTVRDPNFLKAALTTKNERATKRRLRVVVYDKNKPERASLRLHETGGAKLPRGKALAVPTGAIAAKRTGKGVPKRLRPRAVPNSFVKGDALFQRYGKGKDRHLRLMYVLKASTPVRAAVPFHADFDRAVRRAMPVQFRAAMRRAMATARKTK